MSSVHGEKVESVTPYGRGPSGEGHEKPHQGVVAHTEQGNDYLVHKGPDYGPPEGGDTVATDAVHMSEKWHPIGETKSAENTEIRDLIKDGGKEWSMPNEHCITTTNDMMKNTAERTGGEDTD